MTDRSGLLWSLLRRLGKGEGKVAAVIGLEASECQRAVEHLRSGAPDVPIWLFSTAAPSQGTADMCERVCVRRRSTALFLEAQKQLWPKSVALSVGMWTGGHGRWLLKLAPFLIPPFRGLFMNESGDFLAGAANIRRHFRQRMRDADASRFLWMIGKGDLKVAAVFAYDAVHCHRAVLYFRSAVPTVPIWLYSTVEPLPETAEVCERVLVGRSSLVLMAQAERQLWPRRVALTFGFWIRRRGHWLFKFAPFLVLPFRTLIMNEAGDFMAGTPGNIWKHVRHRIWDAGDSFGGRLRFLWRFLTYHIWRSGPVRRAKDEVVAAALLVLATILRIFGYPHRRWFHLLRGENGLAVVPQPGSDRAAIANFRLKGVTWDAAGLESFAGASDARWILWQEKDAPSEEAQDMAPLLENEAGFAVSRQWSMRRWKSVMLWTAPFRPLQPDEAARLQAPLARSILVDRRKLLALGVPRTSMSQTAWMLLFWKASAAGWKSYSVGQLSTLREQPDLPTHETAFFLRVICNRELRQLGAAAPHLERGNIGFSTKLQKPISRNGDRPLVLLVSPFLPYPLSHGGAVRIYNLCRALSDRVDFVLAAIREIDDAVEYARLHEIFRQVYIIDKDERPSKDRRLPEQVRHYQSRSLRAFITDLASQLRPDLLQIEYTQMAGFRDAAPQIPAILVEHDLTFSLYGQLAEKNRTAAARREHQRWLEFERHWLSLYEAVWTVSEDDRASALAAGSRRTGVYTVANGVDIVRFQPKDEPAREPEVLYVGSFRHLPNILGFEKLRDAIMPPVWRRFPDTRLRVVGGPQHEVFWAEFGRKGRPGAGDNRIEMHDFVEDLRPLYARASVVVVPLEVSAGTNIKVMEAMACGKPVVTTPAGCAGLRLRDGSDALVRADAGEFARAVGDLIADPAERRRMGAQARRTVEERFSWTAIAEAAFETYSLLCATRQNTGR